MKKYSDPTRRKEKEIWEFQYSWWFAREEETKAIFIIVATVLNILLLNSCNQGNKT